MMEKYLTIFRTVDNFVFKGDDGKTPAMWLGFTKAPLEYEDILWPGQRVPRPKAVRRRGEEGGCCLNIQRALDSGLIQARQCLKGSGDDLA